MKLRFSSFLISFIFGFITSVSAQEEISIGKEYTFPSDILDQERSIYIHLPDSYNTTEKEYPVLYILDGQWFFSNGIAIQNALRVPGRLPEMIVIGIKNQNPLRRTLFGPESEKFLGYMEKEVIRFVDSNYRTSGERILFGWEEGGFFSCSALLHKSQLFNAAIASNGAYMDDNMINNFLNLNLSKEKYLFISNSRKDIYSINSTEALSDLLNQKKPKNLRWEYRLFNDEIHESLAYLALYHGLNYYYHNFDSLVFSSIEAYENLGGLPYLISYFKQRGERYGFSQEIDASTKNSLIWLAWKRNNYNAFHAFMIEFKEVLATKRYDSAYWQCRLGQFYLKHKDAENALGFFINGIDNYPSSTKQAEMHAGLGEVYILKGNKKKARKHLAIAVELSARNEDPNFNIYKELLEKLEK